MKLSRYNIFFSHREKRYVYNTLSTSLVEIESESTLLSSSNVEKSKSLGFVVDCDSDEVLKYQYYFDKCRFLEKGSVLGITYIPTYKCNLRCTYCYEGIDNFTESEALRSGEAINAIVAFVLLKIKSENFSKIELSLYGGEPLLYSRECVLLSDAIRQVAKEHNLNFSSRIFTNGLLLTDELIEQLIRPNDMMIQLTLDGLRTTHDKMRVDINNEGTFNKTVSLIKRLSSKGLGCNTTIRINVRPDNLQEIDDLCSLLSGLTHRVYFSVLEDIGRGKNCSGSCIPIGQFKAEMYYSLLNVARKYGFESRFRPFGKRKPCSFYSENKFFIDAALQVYKCFAICGKLEYSVGRLETSGKLKLSSTFFSQVMHTPFSTEKCTNCALLPLCAGGCPKRVIYKRGALNGFDCDLTQDELIKVLGAYIDYTRG